jgi:MFS family permease
LVEREIHHHVNWRELFATPGFRWLFVAMFISLFGTGLNFNGVTWWVLQETGSTVAVSLMTILVMLPGLVVPPFGGVLIDRVDRRYLGITLDVLRSLVVLGASALMFSGRGQVWHIYGMVLLLGVGFAIYWSTANALVQEVIPRSQLGAANAVVLIAIQGGMMSAGAVVGFVYEQLGLGGILAMDGATYLASAFCLMNLRRGYFSPARHAEHLQAEPPTIEAPPPPKPTDEAVIPPIVEPGIATGFLADLKEGLGYLRRESRVFALGLTYACMMAGVISGNVLVVALASDLLRAGPVGYGWIEFGWAFGAIMGGLLVGSLVRWRSPGAVLVSALAILAVGHALFPYVKWLALAVVANALFGACRALGGVLTQSSIMAAVPRRLMGRTQSAFSVISTIMQVVMSFSLGWLAQHVGLGIAFGVLGVLYGGATLAAVRATSLSAAEHEPRHAG